MGRYEKTRMLEAAAGRHHVVDLQSSGTHRALPLLLASLAGLLGPAQTLAASSSSIPPRTWRSPSPGALEDPIPAKEGSLEQLVAATATIWPQIDGIIDQDEWSDASFYTIAVSGGNWHSLYLKVGSLLGPNGETAGDCYPYPENVDYVLPCGDYLEMAVSGESAGTVDFVEVFFDEGNDRAQGSGSGDGKLTTYQEDQKLLNYGGFENGSCMSLFGQIEGCPEPSCAPWLSSDCWQCRYTQAEESGDLCYWSENPALTVPPIYGSRTQVMDGYYLNDGGAVGWVQQSQGANFIGFLSSDQSQAELLIPLVGDDHPTFLAGDVSDLNVAMGEIPNFILSTPLGFYPTLALPNSASNWMPVQLGGAREEGEDSGGCSPSTTGRSSGAGLLPLGICVLGIKLRRRARRSGQS